MWQVLGWDAAGQTRSLLPKGSLPRGKSGRAALLREREELGWGGRTAQGALGREVQGR